MHQRMGRQKKNAPRSALDRKNQGNPVLCLPDPTQELITPKEAAEKNDNLRVGLPNDQVPVIKYQLQRLCPLSLHSNLKITGFMTH